MKALQFFLIYFSTAQLVSKSCSSSLVHFVGLYTPEQRNVYLFIHCQELPFFKARILKISPHRDATVLNLFSSSSDSLFLFDAIVDFFVINTSTLYTKVNINLLSCIFYQAVATVPVAFISINIVFFYKREKASVFPPWFR